MEISKSLKQAEKVLLFLTFLLFPLVFAPTFTNIFAIPKLVLLAVLAGASLLIKAVRVVMERKIEIRASKFDTSIFLLMLAYLLSVLLVSPNKVEAMLDPNRGALLVILLGTLVLTLPKDKVLALKAALISTIVMFVVTFLSYFSLLGFLPKSLAFINSKGFNLVGNLLNQALLAGFFLALAFEQLRETETKTENTSPVAHHTEKHQMLLNGLFLAGLLTTVLSLYTLLKDTKLQLFPLSASWQISVDVLKAPKNALFGVGPANYYSLYTQSRPLSLNSTSLWNTAVEYSRSAFLHVLSEVGLLGVIALTLILMRLWQSRKANRLTLGTLLILGWTLLLPVSQAYFFLLFFAVYLVKETREVKKMDLTDLDLFAYATGVFVLLVVGAFGYFFGRAEYADYLITKSFTAAQQNKVQEMYQLQVDSIGLNPYNRTARNAFIQTNMVLANSLAQKKKPTDADKQQYSKLIEQAITHARDAVTLNPSQADSWANLASVYQVLLGQANGAAEWTVASYQRAIATDPRNPTYYFGMGSVYYSLKNYEEASRFFEQAISLKNDMANYYYNLAWSDYQQQKFAKAVNALETAQQLVQKGSGDYKKIGKELAEFKKKLPAETTETENTEAKKAETLSQPTTIPTGKPTIELPKDSAPPTVSVTPTPVNIP